MAEADRLVTVSWVWGKEFEELGAKEVRVITNGFDHEDFAFEKPRLEDRFLCSHIGYLNADRNSRTCGRPSANYVKEIPRFREELHLRFVGKTDHIAFQQLEELGPDGPGRTDRLCSP